MFNYSKRNKIIVSIIVLTIADFFLIKINYQKKNQSSNLIFKSNQINSNKENNKTNKEKVNNAKQILKVNEIVLNQYKQNDWRIFIPTLNLDAPILEGTSQSILRKAVGHFENTPTIDGNVCLAAHNRGYKYNFFQEIKRLNIGDVITYQKGEVSRIYSVKWKGKIEETDLSYIKNTKENVLTLLTCVEDMPEYRLCVQAYEIK